MCPNCLRMAFLAHKQARPITPGDFSFSSSVPKFGKSDNILPRLIFGVLGVCSMKCVCSPSPLKLKIWPNFISKSLKESFLKSQINILQIWWWLSPDSCRRNPKIGLLVVIALLLNGRLGSQVQTFKKVSPSICWKTPRKGGKSGNEAQAFVHNLLL